jgi:phosphate transport system ATP-binding protein
MNRPDPPAQDQSSTEMLNAIPQPGAAEPQGIASPTPTLPEAPTDRGRRVTVKDLNAYYGKIHAVKDVSLSFEPNKATAIIGPSGCGKSTTVRCINRMHEEIPDAYARGTITLDDQDICAADVDVVSVRRAIGMVFQKPNPFPTMSIFDNVAAGLRLTGTKSANLHDRVEGALRRAGLWDEVKDRLKAAGIGLSGGQQQRLCIARTIAVEPEVILMDEPASALDPKATLKIEELVDTLKERYTIVIVTHNMQQAARVADYTAFMLGEGGPGSLVEYGETDKMFTNPHDTRTEQYISGKFG